MAERRAVLIVEDESIVAHDLQRTLIELGYDAFAVAASAEEALARAAERRPDLALVDVRIKGKLDGIQAAQLLQERFRVPIVYLTAYADDATLERAKQTLPGGYLVKPVKATELRTTIEITLYRHGQEGSAPAPPGIPPPPRPAARDVHASVASVRQQLEHILTSADFDASRRSRDFLRFIVEETLEGRGEDLGQSSIAIRVFGRREDFDPLVDPIVRIQAGRLRRSLERYYLLSGKQDLVRIELPKGAYVPTFGTIAAPESSGALPTPGPATAPSVEWPSVVVQPFEMATAETGIAELTSRFGEELAAELGRYRELAVVRREDREAVTRSDGHAPRFTLSGTIRGATGGLEIGARLVDTRSGVQLWMDTYYTPLKPGRRAGSLEDVARVVAARVGSEEGLVAQRLAAELRQGRPVGPAAYVAVLRSYEFQLVRDHASLPAVLDALRQVAGDLPETSLAWSRLARVYLANHAFEIAAISTPLEDALAYAQTGVRLDPSSRRARCTLAGVLLVKGELAAARDEAEKALRLTPDSLVYLEIIGWLLTLAGDWDQGVPLAREAGARNPHLLPHVDYALWADHMRRCEFELAYRRALDYRDTAFFWRPLMRAACLGQLGRARDAEPELAELLGKKPDFASRGRTLIARFIKFAEVQEAVAEGLRKAGLELS